MIHWLVVLLYLLGTTHEAIVGRGTKYSFALWIVVIIIRIEHKITSDKVFILVSQPRMRTIFSQDFSGKILHPASNYCARTPMVQGV